MKKVTRTEKVSLEELKLIAENSFGNMLKAVVDIQKGIMIVGGQLHADEERALMEEGSDQDNLWGINIYPEEKNDVFIEYDSMINLRPAQKNMTRGICDPKVRQKIEKIVLELITK